jgi:tyrosyl-tRNA synthetase
VRFRIDAELLHRFPDICIGLVVAIGVENSRRAPAIGTLLRESEFGARNRYSGPEGMDDPSIVVWREAFTALDMSPNKYKTSVEALTSRAVKGTPLPDLNPAVDLANALSLKYSVPLGAHDLDRVHGDIVVGPARAGSLFTPMGHVDQETVEECEIVYADDQDVLTRRWVWRQSDRSKVVAQSHNIVFPIDGWVGRTDVAVRAAQGDLVRHLETSLGAKTWTVFLDAKHPEALILKEGSLPEHVVSGNGGFRMTGLGYLERPHNSRRIESTTREDADSNDTAPDPVEGITRRWGNQDSIGALLNRATADVVVREELESRLQRGDRLRIKFGVDPTSPALHLGHAVVLRKLRAFQQLGHTVCLVIGDFTAQIGDASDKTSMRQMLSEEDVYQNLATYKKQISRILDESKVEWSYNADWLGPLRFKDVVGLAANFTVAQILERENFKNRYDLGQPIGLQEFLYPLMQGYDSVALRADVEVGGTEQLFNLLAGRTLQRAFGQQPQAVMTCALLLGLDGRKMSKSYGNAILLEDSAKDMYGKVMSFADDQIVRGFELCTDVPLSQLDVIESDLDAGTNPMVWKKRLAFEITQLYHGPARAQSAQKAFESVVQRKERPDEIPEARLDRGGPWPLADLLVSVGLTKSKTEARQKAIEGAVYVDDVRMSDPKEAIDTQDGMVIKLGRRYRRVSLPT